MGYSIDEHNDERQNLLAQVLAPATDRLLTRLKLAPNSQCLDLGCGWGGTTRKIAEYLGAGGECIGVEGNPDLVERAKAQPWSGAKVSFQAGDALHLPFEDGSFDFVFTRYLLTHLAEPKTAISEMRRVCKKGGVVAAVEPDFAFQCAYPHSWAFDRIPDLWGHIFADAFIGRKLAPLFRACELPGVMATTESIMEVTGSVLKRTHRMTIEATGPALIERGIIDKAEHEKLVAEFLRVERDPEIVCMSHTVACAWAVRS